MSNFNLVSWLTLCVLLLTGCNSDADHSLSIAEEEQFITFNIDEDIAIRNRSDVKLGSGVNATELSYVIRDSNGDVVYATDWTDSPTPSFVDGKWQLAVKLKRNTQYEVLFACASQRFIITNDISDSRLKRGDHLILLYPDCIDLGVFESDECYLMGSPLDELFTYYGHYQCGDSEDITLRRPLCEVTIACPASSPFQYAAAGWNAGRLLLRPDAIRFGTMNYADAYLDVDFGYHDEIIDYYGEQITLDGIIPNGSDYKVLNTFRFSTTRYPNDFGIYVDDIDNFTVYIPEKSAYYDIPMGGSLGSSDCIFQPNRRVIVIIDEQSESLSFDIRIVDDYNFTIAEDNVVQTQLSGSFVNTSTESNWFYWKSKYSTSSSNGTKMPIAVDESTYDFNVTVDPKNVTGSYMFWDNKGLLSIATFPSVPSLNYLDHMFDGCTALVSVNLTGAMLSNAYRCQYMFWRCTNLEYIDFGDFSASNIVDRDSYYEMMFSGCSKLTHIRCTTTFRDWCWANASAISLPDAMKEGGSGTWELID